MSVGAVDAAIYAVNDEFVEYSISDEQQSFTISPCSGEIRVAGDADLDFETRLADRTATFAIIVRASDPSTQSKLADCNVTVVVVNVDEPPTFHGDGQTLNV